MYSGKNDSVDPPNYNIDSIPIATAEPVIDLSSLAAPHHQNHYNAPTNRHGDNNNNNNNNNFSHQPIDENQISQLVDQGYTRGLSNSLQKTKNTFAKRIWIIDNSGSMQVDDGNRIVETKNRKNVRFIQCTRWDEITECIKYHIQLAGVIRAPTDFRFLNDPGSCVGQQRFEVATGSSNGDGVQNGLNIISKVRPGGCTPLTSHILDISYEVSKMSNDLRRSGQKIAIIIATDGLPTDEAGHGGRALQNEFVEALRKLEGLPVWVVIRLCTDEDNVVDFYNELDSALELSIEVLDDFVAEAKEVHGYNPWLNYSLPIHRMREMGYHDRVFDMLDERKLTKSELRYFCSLLFGDQYFDGAPDPDIEFSDFLKFLQNLLKKEKLQWSPIKKKMIPCIDLSSLNGIYGDSNCSCM